MLAVVERATSAYLDYWHGHGAENQYRYYRCEGCRGLVTWAAIRRGGCSCLLSSRVRPARLSFFEKARCLLAPWTV